MFCCTFLATFLFSFFFFYKFNTHPCVTSDCHDAINCTSWRQVTNQHQAMWWCRTSKQTLWKLFGQPHLCRCELSFNDVVLQNKHYENSLVNPTYAGASFPLKKDNSHRRRWSWLKSFHSVCFEVRHHHVAWCWFVTRRHDASKQTLWKLFSQPHLRRCELSFKGQLAPA